MSGKYEEMGRKILEFVGGKDNVSQFTHCVTRLRFILKDRSLIQEELLKDVPGVLGTRWAGEQLQVIVGQAVDDIYEEICSQGGFAHAEAVEENLDGSLAKKHLSPKDVPGAMLRTLQGCVFPIIPIMIPAGLMMLIASMLGPNLFNVLPADNDLIVLLNFVGNAGYYFIPIFMAWSAAKYFNTSIPVALFLGAVLVHPTLLQMVEQGTSFTVYGIPMQLVKYSNQFLPSIVSVWVMSYVYAFFKKRLPESLRYAFLPLFTMLVMLPVTLCVIGPLGSWFGNVVGAFATWLSNVAGPVALGLIGGLWYYLVALGMDKAITPISMQQFAQFGYDNLFWCSAIFGTYSLLGVAVASILRSHGDRRSIAVSNAITLGVGGVSEPTIYASVMPSKVNMAALFSGGFVGGLIGGFFGCKAWTFGTGNVLFAAVFAGGDGSSLVPGIIGSVVAFCVGFAVSYVGGGKAHEEAKEAQQERVLESEL